MSDMTLQNSCSCSMENGMRRWLVNISEWNPSEEHFAFLISLFPEDGQRAITRFARFVDRKRAFVSRLLQYSLVHEVLGIPFDRIIINRTIEGKPYLSNKEVLPFPHFNFNASHHGDYVGIASESICLVGLDIVSIAMPEGEEVLDFIENFSSYFTAFEWKNILDASTPDKILTEFYRYWSLKEAYVKAIGTGIGYGLHRLEFHHTDWSNIFVTIDGIESRKWKFMLIKLDDKHMASLARGFTQEVDDNLQPNLDYLEESLDALIVADPSFILLRMDDLLSQTLKKVVHGNIFHL